MARFDGRTVVVNGAASGIGRVCARLLHREGANVVALDLDAQQVQLPSTTSATFSA